MISIIIVSFNTQELLKECLTSIYNANIKNPFEVIVIDNHSVDDSVNMVKDRFPAVIIVENDTNNGFAKANNQAVQIARGDYILLLNSDTLVFDNTIDNTISFMKNNQGADIVGCKLLNSDGSLQASCRSFPSLWNIFVESSLLYKILPKTKLFGAYHMSYFLHDRTQKVDVVMGAFMMTHKKVVEKIGLFDESYFMYAEETDFCYRAHNNGFNTFFYSDASIVHFGGGSRQTKLSFFEQIHIAQIIFIRKNFKGIYKVACLFFKKTGILVRVPLYYIIGLLTTKKSFLVKSNIYRSVFWKTLWK